MFPVYIAVALLQLVGYECTWLSLLHTTSPCVLRTGEVDRD